ncbi:MAG TPA: HAD family phosphatase [Allosphingosinicella sp.]|nr:HAD family phosphatase [Allosphingosinicella sp.]
MSVSPLAELLRTKRLLIFDFDGTIVDSSPLHARAFNEAFAGDGVTVDYPSIAGLTTDTAIDQVALGAGLSLDPEKRALLIADKRARALRLIEAELEPIAGSLDFLKRAGTLFPMALCTSGSRPTIERALERVGLVGAFDPVITAGDVRQGKPHPEGFLKAAAHHGVAPAQALVFEDAPSGLAAASAAGIEAVHVVEPGAAREAGQADWPMLNAALAELAR